MSIESVDKQVLYLGRWVDREHFCTFVYNSTGQHLAKSYDEFSRLIATGAWFATKEDVIKAEEVKKEEDNIVTINKRGKKCQNPNNR